MSPTNPYQASEQSHPRSDLRFSRNTLTKKSRRWLIAISLLGVIHFAISLKCWSELYWYYEAHSITAHFVGELPFLLLGLGLFLLNVAAFIFSLYGFREAIPTCFAALLATVALFIFEVMILGKWQMAILHANWGHEDVYMNWWWLNYAVRYGKFVF